MTVRVKSQRHLPGPLCVARDETTTYCGKLVCEVQHYKPGEVVPLRSDNCLACMAAVTGLRLPILEFSEPVPMRLHCPECHRLHLDEGVWAKKPHHTHSCQYCGLTWRPAVIETVGVRFLPGFKND